MSFFLLLNTIEDIVMNVGNQTAIDFHSICPILLFFPAAGW